MLRAVELGKLTLLIVLIHGAVLMFHCLISDNNNSNKDPSLPQEQTGSKLNIFFLPPLFPLKNRLVTYSQKRVTEIN